MFKSPAVDQTWSILNQQRNNQYTNTSLELIKPTVMEDAQFRIPHFQQTQDSQSLISGYGQPLAQSRHLVNQSHYMKSLNLQNATTQAEQSCTSKTDPSVP